MNNVYIVGGLRSYIGLKNGQFKNVSADMLASAVMFNVCRKFKEPNPDMVIGGNGIGGGGNITRLAALLADISSPAVTVDSQCSSALESVSFGASMISCGEAQTVLCGGFESSSTQPKRTYSPNHPEYADKDYYTAQFSPESNNENIMIYHAQKTAMDFDITRAQMDRFVVKSHQNAARARDLHIFDDFIAPVFRTKRDEGIRDSMSDDLVSRVNPIIKDCPYMTAANTSLINDGAAFVLLASEKYVRKNKIKPLAKVVKTARAAVEPQHSPYAAIQAIKNIGSEFNIGCYEINEAFALIDELAKREIPNMRNLNIFGGALAYGHPYGASGAVILLHLIRSMQYKKEKYGVCSVAAAGGLGCAMLLER